MLTWGDAGILATSSTGANAGNSIFNGLLGSLFGSGGSAVDEQMKYNWKLIEPKRELGGKSYQDILNQMAANLNQQLTNQQSAATWSLAQKYATQLPALQRAGMEIAGINPILAYTSLGNSSSPVVGSASGSSSNPPGLSAHAKNISNLSGSAFGVKEMYETISGMLDTQHKQMSADVDIKKEQAKNIAAQTLETEARTARDIAETQKPGVVGQAIRSALSTASDLREGITSFLENLRDYSEDNDSKSKPSVGVEIDGKPHSKHFYKEAFDSPYQSWFFD